MLVYDLNTSFYGVLINMVSFITVMRNMVYKILHKLFGWDYIHWNNTADSGIARIHVDGENIPYYFRYKSSKIIDRPTDPFNRIIWLTCNHKKYLRA